MVRALQVIWPIIFFTLVGCSAETAPNEKKPLTRTKVSNSVIDTTGISKARLERVQVVLQKEVDEGIRAGFVAIIAKDGDIVYQAAVGMADRENDIPMTVNTRFRIASMTKAITTVALMQLVEEGSVLLSDPVSKYIPAFADMQVATSQKAKADGTFESVPLKRPITLHHLLTHTSGLNYGSEETDLDKLYNENNLNLIEGDLAARIDRLTTLPLYEQPGEKFRYGYSIDVAGLVVEVVSGKSLETYFNNKIFEPLGMEDTEFFLDESDFDRLAVVYDIDDKGQLVPATKDPSLPAPNDKAQGWMSGGDGLVSSPNDYMRFFLMLLNEGELDGERLLSPVSVSLMLQRNIPSSAGHVADGATYDASGFAFGLGGYVLEQPGLGGEVGVAGQWGWGGYYSTSSFLSPSNELAVIVMSQQLPWNETGSRASGLVKAIAYGALEKKN